MRKDFFDYLNPIKITEYTLWSVTYVIANKFDIPLIIQGENGGLTLGISNSGLGKGPGMHYLDHRYLYPIKKDDPKLMDVLILLGEPIKRPTDVPMFKTLTWEHLLTLFLHFTPRFTT